MSEKKRLTLTGNKMPADVYTKLEQLGTDRKLTPYICSLVQKEEKMDMLIDSLTTIINKVTNVENIVEDLTRKFDDGAIKTSSQLPIKENLVNDVEIVHEGMLEISNRIEGGIEEEIVETDF